MSGFDLFIIIIIVMNVLAAILKKRAQPKRPVLKPVPPAQEKSREEFGTDHSEWDDEGYGIERDRGSTLKPEFHGPENASLEAHAENEANTIKEVTIPVRKKSPNLEVINLSRETHRIWGLRSRSELRRAVLLSEILGPPRSLQD